VNRRHIKITYLLTARSLHGACDIRGKPTIPSWLIASHMTQNRSFWRRTSQPNSWLVLRTIPSWLVQLRNWQKPHLVPVDTSSSIVHVTEPSRTRRPTKCDKTVYRPDWRTAVETLPPGRSRCKIWLQTVTDGEQQSLAYCRHRPPNYWNQHVHTRSGFV